MAVDGQDQSPDVRQRGSQPRGLFSRFRRSTAPTSSLPTVLPRRTYTPRYAHRDALRCMPLSSEARDGPRCGNEQLDFWLSQTSVHPNFWRNRTMLDGSSRSSQSSQSIPILASIAEQDERILYEAQRQMTELPATVPPGIDNPPHQSSPEPHCNAQQCSYPDRMGRDAETSADISNAFCGSISRMSSEVSRTPASSFGEGGATVEEVATENHN